MSSCALTCSNAASLSRASSTAARVSRPAACTLEGFPKCRPRYGCMAFSTFFYFAVFVLLKSARTERDRVIKLNARADLRGLTNYHAGAMVDEKMRANLRARVDVDTGAAVRPLSHDARNQWHFVVKQMRHSINGDRFQRRISENDLFVAFRSRIPFVSSVNVSPKNATH